jgi:translation elongation factor EF-1beta
MNYMSTQPNIIYSNETPMQKLNRHINTLLHLEGDVEVDDGELKVEGTLVSSIKDKILVKVKDEDIETIPLAFTIDALQSALLGFEIETFRPEEKYVVYHVNEQLKLVQK